MFPAERYSAQFTGEPESVSHLGILLSHEDGSDGPGWYGLISLRPTRIPVGHYIVIDNGFRLLNVAGYREWLERKDRESDAINAATAKCACITPAKVR